MHSASIARFVSIIAVVLLATSTTAVAANQRHFSLAAAGDVACAPGELGVPPSGSANGPDNCQETETAGLIESLHPDAVAALDPEREITNDLPFAIALGDILRFDHRLRADIVLRECKL